jgi:hypothetical protein
MNSFLQQVKATLKKFENEREIPHIGKERYHCYYHFTWRGKSRISVKKLIQETKMKLTTSSQPSVSGTLHHSSKQLMRLCSGELSLHKRLDVEQNEYSNEASLCHTATRSHL